MSIDQKVENFSYFASYVQLISFFILLTYNLVIEFTKRSTEEILFW